jgi:LacI family sucrose operon transcriptional repressor
VCEKQQIPYELILTDLGDNYSETSNRMKEVFEKIKEKYPGKRKGIFMSSDTHANILLNLLVREYGKLPEEYQIIGFDNSPIATEAILPITTVGQQTDEIVHEAMKLLVEQIEERKKGKSAMRTGRIHKQVSPVLIRRDTTK